MRTTTVYLLHLEPAYRHARHYMGSCVGTAERRLAEHVAGGTRSSPLVRAAVAAGCTVTIARTWKGGRKLERALKRRHGAAPLCPVCNPRTCAYCFGPIELGSRRRRYCGDVCAWKGRLAGRRERYAQRAATVDPAGTLSLLT